MSSVLYDWAARWRIPAQAVADLQERMGVVGRPATVGDFTGETEADTQQRLRLAAARESWHLWRNNVGECVDQYGNRIRYGLCNDSAKLSEVVKSSDLVGIRPVHIAPHHVGQVLGQFVAREVKAPGWRYMATPREKAQRTYIELVNSLGGDAKFTTGDL